MIFSHNSNKNKNAKMIQIHFLMAKRGLSRSDPQENKKTQGAAYNSVHQPGKMRVENISQGPGFLFLCNSVEYTVGGI